MTMNTKFTPEPWTVEPTTLTNDGARPIMGPDTGRDRVALVDRVAHCKRGEEWKSECEIREANARLIVEAPAMHKALRVQRLILYAMRGVWEREGWGANPEIEDSIAETEAIFARIGGSAPR